MYLNSFKPMSNEMLWFLLQLNYIYNFKIFLIECQHIISFKTTGYVLSDIILDGCIHHYRLIIYIGCLQSIFQTTILFKTKLDGIIHFDP